MTDAQAFRWTLEHQVHYPTITEVALSAGGRSAVYVVREPLMTDERSEFITHLYLVSTEGGEPIQLTYGEYSDYSPRWALDGRTIAFLSTRSGVANLYAMRTGGGEAWALTRYEEAGITAIEWSPDGQSIAFLRPTSPSEEKQKAKKAKDDPIRWDIDFDYVHLFRVPFAIGPRELPEACQITQGRYHVLNLDWAPDGEHIAITHRPTPVEEDWAQTRLAIVSADLPEEGGAYDLEGLTDIARISDWAGNPRVSPDGSWIACMTGEEPPSWAFARRIVLYPLDGGEPRMLAQTPDAQCHLLGWSADGSHVYVVEPWGVNSQVWVVPASGAPGRPLTETPSYKGPLAVSRNDRIVYVAQDFDQPNVLCLLDGQTGDTFQVAGPSMPSDWPDGPLPRTEVVRWQAPDGLEIEGIVTYPLDYQPGRRCPLVVEVHGGPASAFGRQYLASPSRYCDLVGLADHGFCVLRVNPRGSSGYGKAFRYANRGDWGGGDYRDILSGVDHLIELGVVDPERMGILGWSYGGYMTSWVITQTDRFKAACVGAGVTNLMSFNGTADIPGFIPDYIGGEFWEGLDPYRQHSAMFQVKGVRTPTLIQHGQEDIRVPLSQGRELYNALKRQGVPVEMVIYPRQGHSINEPRLVIDLKRRTTAWFERWILGNGESEPE